MVGTLDRRADARLGGGSGRRLGALAAVLAAALPVAALVAAPARPRPDFAFNNGKELISLDPAQASGLAEARVARCLFEGLVIKDAAAQAIAPGAAESWETSPDGRVWTFHLRAELEWSDGSPLEAEDFAFAWRRLIDPATGAPMGRELAIVRGGAQGIRAPDARTLEIELERPCSYLLELAAHPALAPLPRAHLAREAGSSWQKSGRWVSNGPFVLAGRRVNDRLELVKNPRYWAADSVAFERVEAHAIESLTTALNLYWTGELDWIPEVPPGAARSLLGRPDFAPEPALATAFLRLEVERPPLDDRRLRLALALAIDRAALTELVLPAGERPTWSLVPSAMARVPGSESWRQADLRALAGVAGDAQGLAPIAAGRAGELARARELLAELGAERGQLGPLELHYASSDLNRAVCEVLAEGLRRDLGLDVRLAGQETRVYYDTQRRRDYQLSRSSWVADYGDPASFLEAFAGASADNRTGWANAEYDALLDAARAAADAGERLALLAEAERLLLAELPIVPLYELATHNLVDARLDGFEENALDEHAPRFWRWRANADGAR